MTVGEYLSMREKRKRAKKKIPLNRIDTGMVSSFTANMFGWFYLGQRGD
jgi:hypothetical protein